MQASTCRRAWPKRLPRQPRSDEGVLRTPRAQFGAQPEAAQPAQRFGRSLKRPVDVGAARAPRSDKRARPEGVGEQPACAPAQETDISAARGQVLVDHLCISAGRTPQRLHHIETFHLFQRPPHSADGKSDPAPGRSAIRNGNLVVIVDWPFTRRHVQMVDVLPLVPQDIAGMREFTARRSTVCSCRQRELSEIGASPL